MSFLDRIAECNTHDRSRYRPFMVAGQRVGWVRDDFVQRLTAFPDLFMVDDRQVTLDPELETFEQRSVAMDELLCGLASTGYVTGWRGEFFPVSVDFNAPPLLQMERAGIPHFGVRAYGVHLNGFVRAPDGLKMWIGRRAKGKHTYPGMLDNMVAGGQPIGLSLRENLTKECGEEAAIPPELAAKAVPVGAITYVFEDAHGLKPDVQFCYDLELPPDFEPRNTDGEIDEFMLMPIGEVAAIVRDTREFKFNCNLVVIDFLVRHGVIGPEHPDYVSIVTGLHRDEGSL